MDRFEKEEWEKNQLERDHLKKHRLSKKKYYLVLARMLEEKLNSTDKPSNRWKTVVYPTDLGVVAQIKNIWGRTFQKAFKPCGIPKIDHHAVETLVGMAEDKMYAEEDKKQSPGGVYLP